jgi:hypothetical protein
MSNKIDTELVGIFGRWTMASAQCTRLEDLQVDPDRIRQAAPAVMDQRGHPERQKALIDEMDDNTAVALCIWLRDPTKAAELVKLAGARQRARG